jgi:hypothetical protein
MSSAAVVAIAGVTRTTAVTTAARAVGTASEEGASRRLDRLLGDFGSVPGLVPRRGLRIQSGEEQAVPDVGPETIGQTLHHAALVYSTYEGSQLSHFVHEVTNVASALAALIESLAQAGHEVRWETIVE